MLTATTLPLFLGELFEASGMFPGVRFTQEYPREESAGDCIVWKIVRRLPGAGRMRERKPRIRTIRYKANAGEAVIRWAQAFTVIYQFDVYSATNARANQLMDKFEEFMLISAEHLVARGVWHCMFEEQVEDRTLQVPQALAVRSLRYRVGLESVIEVPAPLVRSFSLRRLDGEVDTLVAIVRSDGNAEELNAADIAVIRGIYDRNPDEEGAVEYLCGADWTLYRDPGSDRLYILWLEGGVSPPEGSTYWVKLGQKVVSTAMDLV